MTCLAKFSSNCRPIFLFLHTTCQLAHKTNTWLSLDLSLIWCSANDFFYIHRMNGLVKSNLFIPIDYDVMIFLDDWIMISAVSYSFIWAVMSFRQNYISRALRTLILLRFLLVLSLKNTGPFTIHGLVSSMTMDFLLVKCLKIYLAIPAPDENHRFVSV